ncbi:hypothetical protein Tsubulata_049040, partial [Turnera subulata]
TKSVEYMPFLLSFFLFLNGGIWSAYAVLVKDFYIGVPNAIGFILGSAQLILYAIYKTKSISQKSTKSREEEEGSAHLVREGVEMGAYGGGGGGGGDHHNKDDVKNRSLGKGKSLPKPSISRQHSLQKLVKTLSFDLQQSSWAREADIEKGKPDGHS